jgi:hypothetical protein
MGSRSLNKNNFIEAACIRSSIANSQVNGCRPVLQTSLTSFFSVDFIAKKAKKHYFSLSN